MGSNSNNGSGNLIELALASIYRSMKPLESKGEEDFRCWEDIQTGLEHLAKFYALRSPEEVHVDSVSCEQVYDTIQSLKPEMCKDIRARAALGMVYQATKQAFIRYDVMEENAEGLFMTQEGLQTLSSLILHPSRTPTMPYIPNQLTTLMKKLLADVESDES